MKKLADSCWLLAVSVAMATGVARAATIDVTSANIAQNRTLQNGNTYRFTGNVEYTAAATGAIEEMVLEGAEPGFYYTLFKSTDVTVVLEQENHDPDNCDCKALSDGKVTFTNVEKPSAAVGFFSVRAFVKESFTSNPFGGGGFGGFGE